MSTLPLNYAILKLFLTVDEADTATVMAALQGTYGRVRAFTPKAVTEALMTAETNGLLEETRFDLGEDQRLRVFYRATDSGRAMITRYIG